MSEILHIEASAGLQTARGESHKRTSRVAQEDSAASPVMGVEALARWPMLAAAMGQYEKRVAENFTRQAYACVFSGIIRMEDRRRLTQLADELGIRPFDAQLLIACAVRQWALDHRYDSHPTREAPRLSFEYKSVGKMWLRTAIIVSLAVTLDLIILWNWLR